MVMFKESDFHWQWFTWLILLLHFNHNFIWCRHSVQHRITSLNGTHTHTLSLPLLHFFSHVHAFKTLNMKKKCVVRKKLSEPKVEKTNSMVNSPPCIPCKRRNFDIKLKLLTNRRENFYIIFFSSAGFRPLPFLHLTSKRRHRFNTLAHIKYIVTIIKCCNCYYNVREKWWFFAFSSRSSLYVRSSFFHFLLSVWFVLIGCFSCNASTCAICS